MGGVAANSYLDSLASSNVDSLPFSTVSPLDNEAGGFLSIASFLGWWSVLIWAVNLFLILPYIWFVIVKYKSIGCCKFAIVLSTFILWLVYSIGLVLYYYEFYAFFHNFAELQ